MTERTHMAKKAKVATKRLSQAELRKIARRLNLAEGKSEAEFNDWIIRVAKRPDAVEYLEGRAARRDAAEKPRRQREAPSRVPNLQSAPELPKAKTTTILVELTIGDWHPDGYGVSQKNPPQRLRMPDRRLQPQQSHAIARLFNGAIEAKAKMLGGREITNKEDLVLYVLEQIGQAIEDHDRKAG